MRQGLTVHILTPRTTLQTEDYSEINKKPEFSTSQSFQEYETRPFSPQFDTHSSNLLV